MSGAERHVTTGPAQTEALAEEFSRRLGPGDRVALVGELGGGKTCFVRGVARGLGAGGYVKSPSFTLLHIYEGGRVTLYHIDLYRIANPGEFVDSGLEEYVYSDGVSVIEWADKVPDLADECDFLVRFTHAGGDSRVVEITARRPPAA